ncbi:hypothetical protein [Caulobacter sp. S45]|uniref:hypothetical protein n=1 Tax=Caulobacter sp. S45 TaxID=1641861 RepID=UPI001576E881|nr:hypothetical protein [Caulobacter sp. S45]
MASKVQIGLLVLQAVQLAFILLHDWAPLGRLNNLAAVRASDPPAKLLRVTLLSALPFALVFSATCVYGTKPWPMWLRTWLLWTYIAAAAGAVIAWWGPYLFWRSPEREARYRIRFAGTLKVLPERRGISPDLLHILFHLCIVSTLVLILRL